MVESSTGPAVSLEREDQPLDLTRLEFGLLAYLMHRPGRVVPRQELLEQLWGFETGATATITVHVGQLRRRSKTSPPNPFICGPFEVWATDSTRSPRVRLGCAGVAVASSCGQQRKFCGSGCAKPVLGASAG